LQRLTITFSASRGDLGKPYHVWQAAQCAIDQRRIGAPLFLRGSKHRDFHLRSWCPPLHRYGKTPQRFSIAHAWPVEAGETITLFINVGQRRVTSGYKYFRDFAFVEWAGTVHEVSGRITNGVFSSKIDRSV
jgi:hypothetical protein